MRHPSLDVLMFHGPIELQTAHPYVPSPGPLSHFTFQSSSHFFVVPMFFGGTILRHVGIYMTYLCSQVSYPGSAILPQGSSPDRLTSALPLLFPLPQPPPQSICQHP